MKKDSFEVLLASEKLLPNRKLFASWATPEQMGSTIEESYTLYVERRDRVIQMVTQSIRTRCESEFGSCPILSSSEGHLYVAKDNKDADRAVKLLKNGKFPEGTISHVFLRNFDPDTYYKDNNFAMTIYLTNDIDSLRKELNHYEDIINLYKSKGDDEIVIFDLEWFDDYVFEDGLHWYCGESNCTFSASLETVRYIFKGQLDKGDALLFYLEGFSIDIDWLKEEEIYDDVMDAIKRMKPIDTNFRIEDGIQKISKSKKKKEKLDEWRIDRTGESNKKWKERNSGETFLTQEQIDGGITLNEMKNACNSTTTDQESIINVISAAYSQCFPKRAKLTGGYETHVKTMFDLIIHANDQTEFDAGLYILQKSYSLTKQTVLMADSSNIAMGKAYQMIVDDYGVGGSHIVQSLLSLPLRSSLQPLQCIFDL